MREDALVHVVRVTSEGLIFAQVEKLRPGTRLSPRAAVAITTTAGDRWPAEVISEGPSGAILFRPLLDARTADIPEKDVDRARDFAALVVDTDEDGIPDSIEADLLSRFRPYFS